MPRGATIVLMSDPWPPSEDPNRPPFEDISWGKFLRKLPGDLARGAIELMGHAIKLVVAVAVGIGVLYGACQGVGQVVKWNDSRSCKENLQADVAALYAATADPTVTKCSGDAKSSTCFIQTLEQGQYVTHAMTGDCSKRHFTKLVRAAYGDADTELWMKEARDFNRDITFHRD